MKAITFDAKPFQNSTFDHVSNSTARKCYAYCYNLQQTHFTQSASIFLNWDSLRWTHKKFIFQLKWWWGSKPFWGNASSLTLEKKYNFFKKNKELWSITLIKSSKKEEEERFYRRKWKNFLKGFLMCNEKISWFYGFHSRAHIQKPRWIENVYIHERMRLKIKYYTQTR